MGLQIDAQSIALNKQLIHCCKFGQIEQVKKFLATSDSRLNWDRAFITLCSENGAKKDKLIALLLEEVKTLDFPIIFRHFVSENNLDIIKQLDAYLPNTKTYIDELLFLSCHPQRFDTFIYLLENFSFDLSTLNDGFIQACKLGYLPIVQFLLEHNKANIHYLDDYGLRQAGNHQHLEVIKYLLTSPYLADKANPYAMDDDLSIGVIMRNDKTTYRYLYEDYGLKETQRVKEYREFKNFAL